MDNFNRILSFIIGLVVVVVIVAIIANRINLGRRVSTLSNSLRKTTTTPSPSQAPTVSPTPTQKVVASSNSGYQTKGGASTPPKTIPQTGATTLLVPLSLAGAFIGLRLKNSGKK